MAGSLPQSGVELVAKGAASFLSDIGRAQRSLLDFGDVPGKVGGAFGGFREVAVGALREVGAMATQALADAGRAAAGFIKDSVGVAGDFEQVLNVLSATSGASADELARVSAKAKELGADLTLPATSASEAAEVMLELSKAGMTVQESMDAAKGSLQLAAAAQVDGAKAAEIMSGALNAFELPATEAAHVADLLAGGANASSASMTDLAQGLQQGGFAFHAAGQNVDDLVTSLAALTNVGLTGSDAGTALKNAMMRLMNPTKKAAGEMAAVGFSAYDAQGKMKPWPMLLHDLRSALSGMNDEQRNAWLGTVFLSDGMKAMIPLLNMSEAEYAELQAAVGKTGSASEVAGAQMQGWNGAVAGLLSQLETLQLTIGQALLPLLTPLAFKAAELVGAFGALAEKFLTMLPTIASSAEPFRALLQALVILNPSLIGVAGILLTVYDALSPVIGALLDAGVGSVEFAEALGGLLGPLGVTQEAIWAGQAALLAIWDAIQQVAGILAGQFTGSVAGARGVVATLVNFFLGAVLPTIATVATWFAANLPTAIAAAQAAFAEIAGFIGSIMPTIQSIVTTAITIISAFWREHSDEIATITQGTWQIVQGVIQVVLGVIQGAFAIFAAGMTGENEKYLGVIRESNTTIWSGISSFLTGVLNIIAAGFGTSLDGIKKTWESNFRMFGVIADKLMQAAQRAIQPALDAISGAFNGIKSAIDGAISKVRAFIDAASKIKVPKLFTPGSPTPFEMGIRGITAALQEAAGRAVPAFAAEVRSIAPAAMPGPAAYGGSTVTNTTSYTMPVYTNNSPAALQQSLAVMQALAV